MKKLANKILQENPEENVVYMTEDGQAFFNPIQANNHANKNEFAEPESFFREGFEPEDIKAIEEQLVFAMEENETLITIVGEIEQAVDFTKEAPEVTQESNPVVAAVVQLREKHLGAMDLIDKVTVALSTDTVIVDEKEEPVIVEIMKLRVSLSTLQSAFDTLKATPIAVIEETTVEPAAKTTAKNGK
ncbi:hypothetical protein [Flavobacterium maritimum]|uniref:hypothetical protein n=1 Tax=Flavobacterium maritimum TaxID=3149042 RepID=UPI0032B5016E